MKIRIDKENDVLYFRIDEKRIVESEEVQPGVILDYDDENRVVGIEILGISKRISPEQLSSIHFQTA
ncbi:MAG: DUF2283 domain-containing protein [Desulfosarcina sp.]